MLLAFLAQNTTSFVISSNVHHAPLLKALFLRYAFPHEDTLATDGFFERVDFLSLIAAVLPSCSSLPLYAPEHEFFVASDCRSSSLDHD